MDEAHFLDILSGQRRGVSFDLLRAALQVASWGYRLAMQGRNWAYEHGVLAKASVDAAVISVGNLTTGGTGKTPIVADFVTRLQSGGARPAILSRGYRSLDESGNDEKRVLDRICPGVPHFQQGDRVASAQLALSQRANVLVLDDAFQHRRLARTRDVVLIDATRPWGYGHLLPRGLLREPLSALRRAHLAIITRVDQVSPAALQQIHEEIRRVAPDLECAEVRFQPENFRDRQGQVLGLAQLVDKPLLAFCGIGNPDGFRRTLASLGCSPDLIAFPDHFHYQPGDIRRLEEQARLQNAVALVTTLKDLVKIPETLSLSLPVYALHIGAQYTHGEDLVQKHLKFLIDNPH